MCNKHISMTTEYTMALLPMALPNKAIGTQNISAYTTVGVMSLKPEGPNKAYIIRAPTVCLTSARTKNKK